MSAWLDLTRGIVERGRAMIDLRRAATPDAEGVLELFARLVGAVGEASGTALAAEALERYGALPEGERRLVLVGLAERFEPDGDRLYAAIARHQADPSPLSTAALHTASEPPRQELLRRLNRAPGGTAALVAMREDVINAKRHDPSLAVVDDDFRHLFSSWFNRGFLTMRRIDWQTPAAILERIIRYEAVHEIGDWADLRRRIDPPDRRLYAFFHPALPGEPLIFVEVALTASMPASIEAVLRADREPLAPAEARVATFYSISNCQRGLAGISFGSFLIKQVASELTAEFPAIDTFVTLSPVPELRAWAREEATERPDATLVDAVAILSDDLSPEKVDAVRGILEPLARAYLTEAKNARGRPRDPVARFHLGNGARLERLCWMGDPSPKGLAQSWGAMVNYRYVLEDIERNHEAYANEARVVTGPLWRRGGGRTITLRRTKSPPRTAKPDGTEPDGAEPGADAAT